MSIRGYMCSDETFKKYKTFSVLIYSYINTSGNRKKREIVWKHDTRRAECFHTISSFPNFQECWYNCISIRKNVLYFFYNIAQRTLTEEWREIFRVDIELYQHGS